MTAPLRVGIIGLGTVGSGVARLLLNESARLQRRAGRPIELKAVAVRNPAKPRGVTLPKSVLLTANPTEVATHRDVDVVVELMGGVEPARQHVLAALQHGKDVVTANKALLCEAGDELFQTARKHGRSIGFEAAVAGGCPIIQILGQAMSANQITSMQAIVNGTSNFILTQMFHRGMQYEDAVAEAQRMGYAEADPAMDVDGTDAAQKLSLLVKLAFGTAVVPEDFPVQGIDTIELADLKYADELGYAVKLLATAKLIDGQLEVHTQATLVRQDRPLAQVDGPYNMIALTGDVVGKAVFSAMGAGEQATSSAVLADIVDVAIGRAGLTFRALDLFGDREPLPLQPPEKIFRRYYLRFNVLDRPHVMADITDVLGRKGISLASVIQHEVPEVDEIPTSKEPVVPLVIMTHRTTEGQIRQAAAELDRIAALRPPRVCMPVSD
jgi:homoserine dehydrogenase